MPSTRRTIRHGLALLIIAIVVALASTAGATTALKLDLESLVANSNAIVLGNVTEVRSFKKEGRIFTETTIAVDEAWKGDATEKVTIRHPGGRIGDTVTRVYGLPGFETDERVVVFLSRARTPEGEEASPYTVTGLRQGKFHVATGPDASTQFVVPRIGDMQLLAPREGEQLDADGADATSDPARSGQLDEIDVAKLKRSEPAPIHEKVLALDDFRQRVRRAVDPSVDGESTDGGDQ